MVNTVNVINERGYTPERIEYVLRDIAGNRAIDFRFDLPDRHDIKIGELKGIESARVTYGEFNAIKRTAQFTLNEKEKHGINYLTDQIQPWFILEMPEGGTVEWPLGIFLMESPESNVKGPEKRRNIGAYDKTLILEQYKLPDRKFFGAGTEYIAAVEQLLAMAGLTKVNIEGSPLALETDREFAAGTNCREIVNELLEEINYTSIHIDSVGYARSEAYIPPAQRAVTQYYATDRDSIIAPGFVDTLDIASRANVFVRVAENIERDRPLIATFVNDDPKSPLSTVNRGNRRIVDFETISDVADQETLDNLVRRAAIESTSAYRHFKFSTILMPTHGSAETLYVDIPGVLDVPMKFNETDWEMDLKIGGLMTHTARVIVDL